MAPAAAAWMAGQLWGPMGHEVSAQNQPAWPMGDTPGRAALGEHLGGGVHVGDDLGAAPGMADQAS